MRFLFLLLISLSISGLTAQNNDDISLQLKDFHTAKITDVTAAKNNDFIISADESGKILLYNSKDFTFQKTLRKSNGIPIEKLKLIRNDSLLVFTQKFEFSDGKTDSILSLRLFDNKIIYKNPLKGNLFIEQQDDVIMTCSHNGYINVLEVLDTNFKPITKTFPLHTVKLAAFEPKDLLIAYINQVGISQKSIVLANPKTGKNILDIEIPETQHILHVFFDPKTNDLFAISVNDNDNKLNAYNLSSNPSFNSPEFVTDFDFGKFVTISAINKEGSHFVSITSNSNLPYFPLLLSKNDKRFTSEYIKYPNGVNNSTFLNTSNDVVFFETTNKNFSAIKKFNVYNLNRKTKSKSYPNISTNPYDATFLPDNKWLVVGRELNTKTIIASYEHQLKLYESGTFSNRFGKLDYANYLEVKHKTKELTSSTFMFDKRNGIHPFHGYKIKGEFENDYAFYKYDLIKDKVTKIADEQPEHRNIIDYNNNQNLLLLSQQVYYNNGYTEPQEFILIKDNNPTTLKETYKFGKFSVNGDFLLTITAKNSIKVYETTSLKTVFEKQLTDGSYSIFNMDDTNFAVSNNYRTIDFNSCNKESFIIAQDTLTKSYSSQKVDCSVIKDISYANDKVAIIMEGYGLVLNSKMHQFPISEFPEHVSLNSDGSKLMISFNNGKIIVYDTENFNPLGTTIHPDKNSHVFLSSEGHYFSNINPEDYIIASKNNQTVALEDIENQFFKPKEVLSVFGTPNKTYVESLEKALQLKSENLYATSIDENVGNDRIIEDSKLPANLFVLSIGVSDYKQTDFNLTFADKDAIDIAKLYGNLTDKELYNYNTKFYGDNFNLINSDSTIVSNIKKYSDISAVYELYPVSMDNSYWIENTYGKFYLWNFNTQTTKPIEFPDNYKPNTISFNETIKINPGNSGFYLISDNGDYFSYNFKTGITEKIELPFTEDNILTEPLDKGRWSNFSSSYNDTTYVGNLTIGKTNSSQTSTLSFNLNVVDTFNEKDEIVRDTLDLLDVSNVTFKGISTNAKHLAYSSYENLFIVDLSEEKPIPLKLNIDKDLIRYGSTLHISNDGQSFSILNRFKDDYKYNITSFNRNGEVQANYKLNGENDYSIVGLNLINNNLKWIQQTEPLLQENKYSIDKFRTKTPSSFEKTHINYLTNRNATSKSIISELKDLAENTKPNDQVIVFLAGHGVLDKDLNYYFAPHDMDFNNVSTHGIALNTIIENLKNSPSENKLLLMDSCHSGNTLDMSKSEVVIVDNSKDPNKRGSKARSTSPRSKFKVSDVVSTLFEDFLSTSGITILSASSGEDVAYENKAIGNGAFTSSYIKLLKQELQGNGYVIDESNLESSIDLTNDIIEELLKEVMIITKGKQVPDLRELNKNSKLKMW